MRCYYTFLGSKLDEIYNSNEDKVSMEKLASGSRTPISKAEFDNQLVFFIGDLVAQKISEFEPSK